MENYKAHRDAAIREILLYVCEHKDMPEDAHEQDKAKIVKDSHLSHRRDCLSFTKKRKYPRILRILPSTTSPRSYEMQR